MAHLTLTRRPVPRALPEQAKPRPVPRMTWAEMARAEGHRPGIPCIEPGNSPWHDDPTERIAVILRRFGPDRVGRIQKHTRMSAAQVREALERLIQAGRVSFSITRMANNMDVRIYSLTKAAQ